MDMQVPAIGYTKGSHFVFTAKNADMLVPPGKYIELQPSLDIPGFTAVAISVYEDGARTQTYGLDKNSGLPFMRVDPPQGSVNRKRVQVILYDSAARPLIVQQCILRGDESPSLSIHVAHLPGLGVVKTRVYIAGDFVKEVEGDSFDLKVPMKDVPSGKDMLDVIGVSADGSTYPVESVLLNIQNEIWQQRVYGTPDYLLMKAKLAEAQNDDTQFQYWFDLYAHEPFTKVVGEYYVDDRTQLPPNYFTFNSHWILTQRYAAGKTLEYKRNADKYLQSEARSRLEAARLYAKLHMKQQARSQYRMVLQEVGEDTSLGKTAIAEMQALKTSDS